MNALRQLFHRAYEIAGIWWKRHRRKASETTQAVGNVLPFKRKRKARVQHAVGLRDTLESLDATFARLKEEEAGRYLSPSVKRAIREIGPLIPIGIQIPLDNWRVDVSNMRTWPALIYVSSASNQEDTGKIDSLGNPYVRGQLIYCNKVKRAPCEYPSLQGFKGLIYEVGASYSHKKVAVWMVYYVGIDPTSGAVTLSKRRQREYRSVGSSGHKFSFARTEFKFPYEGYCDEEVDPEEQAALDVSLAFKLWSERGGMWKVSVRTAGRRATFLVGGNDTRYYFKDRKVEALAADGHKKRIIHHVNAHSRTLADGSSVEVKEHIRGIRAFNWRGYKCAVVAPKFHALNLDVFDASSEIFEADDAVPSKMVDMGSAAKRMAMLEDEQLNPSDLRKGAK